MRTMADDLAAVSGVAGPAAPSGKPALALPTPPDQKPRARRLVIGGAVGVVVLLLAALLLAARLPRATGTVADVLPKEATAFLSVRGARPEIQPLLPHLVAPFPGLTTEALAGARDVTYALFPGATPGEPVPALLVRGPATLDLSGAPSLTTVQINDGALVVAAEQRGRVTASGRPRWSSDASLRALFQGLPADADVLVGLKGSAVGAVLQTFAPHPLAEQPPLVLALRQTGESITVDGRFGAGGSAGGDAALLGKLPAASVFAGARADLGRDFTAAAAGGVPDALAAVLRALQGQGDAWQRLLETLVGPWAYAVLPSATPGIRDAALVAPLRGDGASAALRSLEGALLAAGPYLVGAAVPEAVVLETERDGITIRYLNFGSPARAVDYAVVENQLIVATSKDSMYAAVDAVRGTAPALAVSALPSGNGGAPLLVRPSAQVAGDLPAPYRVFLTLADELRLTRDAQGRLRGTARLTTAASAPSSEVPSSPAEAGLRAGTSANGD